MFRSLSHPLTSLLIAASLFYLTMLMLDGTTQAQDGSPPPRPDLDAVQLAVLPSPDHDCSDGRCIFAVTASDDDASPLPSGCSFSVTSSEIYFGRCTTGTYIVGGFRFAHVTLPRYASITYAYLLFTVDGTYTVPLTVNLYSENTANASPFSAASPPTSRPRLGGAATIWAVADTWVSGRSKQTPNVARLVRGIVHRADWQPGNALVILAETADTGLSAGQHRRVFAYDRQKNITNTARLVVYLQTPQAFLPLITIEY